jgi:hypothetical protein
MSRTSARVYLLCSLLRARGWRRRSSRRSGRSSDRGRHHHIRSRRRRSRLRIVSRFLRGCCLRSAGLEPSIVSEAAPMPILRCVQQIDVCRVGQTRTELGTLQQLQKVQRMRMPAHAHRRVSPLQSVPCRTDHDGVRGVRRAVCGVLCAYVMYRMYCGDFQYSRYDRNWTNAGSSNTRVPAKSAQSTAQERGEHRRGEHRRAVQSAQHSTAQHSTRAAAVQRSAKGGEYV